MKLARTFIDLIVPEELGQNDKRDSAIACIKLDSKKETGSDQIDLFLSGEVL
jgi:hypothetical protein